MPALDRVLQLQSQGMQESDIIRVLREENISPLEISDALNQAKVKAAVSDQGFANNSQLSGMEQSMMQQEDISPSQQESYPPAEQSISYEQNQPQNQQYYYQPPGFDTETIAEIAEQVTIEKFEEFTKKTGDLVSFKSETNEKLKELAERIKRIENSLDKIQQAVIGKISEYGENLSFVKKDLGNIHETMSKMMNPLIDNYMEMKRLNEKKKD